jgi:tellurite resistance protein TerC
MEHFVNWIVFGALVFGLFAFDLGILHRKNKVVGAKESILLFSFYFAMGLLFGAYVYHDWGYVKAAEYLTGYIVELSLSLDNIFIISIIFSFLSIPSKYQHRVLFWGIIGVILMRAIFIGFGSYIVSRFEIALYVFAIFLILTGFKMLFMKEHNTDMKDNLILKFIRKYFPVTEKIEGEKFYIKKAGKVLFTPLFVALVLVESIDLIFALDSIPAIFSITTDPFIVYTSNIFAIIGLRSLYFALAAIIRKFAYLKQSLALVLIFIGSKIYIKDFLGLEKFPSSISLSITIGLILGGIFYSIYQDRRRR